MKITTSLLLLIATLFVSVSWTEASTPESATAQPGTAKIEQATTQNQPTDIPWETRATLVEQGILSPMIVFTEKKEWDEVAYLLSLYRSLGSNERAKAEFTGLLQQKNKEGLLATIRLVKAELIQPIRGPITSTTQVKKVFIRTILSAKRWETKMVLMEAMLDIFSIEKMALVEMTATQELQEAIGKELRVTTMAIGNILIAIFEHGIVNPTSLDSRPQSSFPTSPKEPADSKTDL